jgi:tetratricopeptide (TPR) repeat protein
LSVSGARLRLASVLHAMGRFREARDMRRELLAEAEKAPGPDAPFTLSVRSALAESVAALDPVQGASLHDSVLLARLQALGDGHPDTVRSYSLMGEALHAAGDTGGALAGWVCASRLLSAMGGPYAADAAALRMRMAGIFEDGGDPELASWQFREAAELWSGLYGRGSARAVAAMEHQAKSLLALGRAGEAAGVLARAAEASDSQEAAGVRPGRRVPQGGASARERLAPELKLLARIILDGGGDPEEALSVLLCELGLREAISGPASPETLDALFRLACAREACGQGEDALAAHRAALQERERVLGPAHPDTELSRAAVARLSGRP